MLWSSGFTVKVELQRQLEKQIYCTTIPFFPHGSLQYIRKKYV